MLRFAHSLAISAILLLPTVSLAQHDAERNAVRALATGKPDRAEALLAESEGAEASFVRLLLALTAGDTQAALGHAAAALEAGLPFSRLQAGPRELLALLHETPEFRAWIEERGSPILVHGPMLGAVTESSASFWVRTARPATVRIRIGEHLSKPATTLAESDFTAIATIDGLKPDAAYTYELLIDDEPVTSKTAALRTFPKQGKPAAFTVVFGGGAGYAPNRERMWDTIRSVDPTTLLMLGDNVYIDQPTHTLCQQYCYYRRQSRPEWRRLTGSVPTFAIYDDHDFGTDDCVPGPEIDTPTWKREVWRVFQQNWVNPAYGGGPAQPGCWFDFQIGEVHFLMLDGRYYRDGAGKSMLGPAQKKWLKQTLKESTATFKVLASPVPWSEGVKPGSRDPWDGYPQEREEIFSFIEKNRILGVLLVAADRHRTDLRVTKREGGYDLYEFMSSRLTNRHTHKIIETPGLIWGYNKTCSFGLLRFDTTVDDPTVTFECITIDGETVRSHTLRASDLRFPPTATRQAPRP